MLPIKHLSIFKIASLVSSYKLVILNTLNLSVDPGTLHTKLIEITQMVCCFVSQILHQYISLTKHFGLSFAYDASMIWNDLPDDVCSAKSLFIVEEVEKHIYSSFPVLSQSFSVELTPATFLV